MSGAPTNQSNKQGKAVCESVHALVLLREYEAEGKLSTFGKQALAAARAHLSGCPGLMVAESIAHRLEVDVRQRTSEQTLRQYLAAYDHSDAATTEATRPARGRSFAR